MTLNDFKNWVNTELFPNIAIVHPKHKIEQQENGCVNLDFLHILTKKCFIDGHKLYNQIIED